MFDRLEEMLSRYQELETLLGQPELASNPTRIRETTQEMASLREAVEAYRRWKEIEAVLQENEELLSDPDPGIRGLARAEISGHKTE